MYQQTEWLDEVVEHPYRYTETPVGDGTIEHTPSPGTVLQEGTPQSATNFNHIESGIHDAGLAGSIFLQAWKFLKEDVDRHLADHDEEFSAETGTVTLTNSNTANMLFNNSGQTVALQQVRNTMNYDLDIEVTSFSGGQVADVIVYDKQLNGFKLRFEGSASSVTVKYKVRGGMHA